MVKLQYFIDRIVDINGVPTTYHDALWFTLEELQSLTDEQIQAMADERVANWVEAILNPPVEPTETPLDDIITSEFPVEELDGY